MAHTGHIIPCRGVGNPSSTVRHRIGRDPLRRGPQDRRLGHDGVQFPSRQRYLQLLHSLRCQLKEQVHHVDNNPRIPFAYLIMEPGIDR